MQFDDTIVVGVADGEDFGVHCDRDAELLVNLAAQAVGVRFARLALAAGELSQALEMDAAWPPGHEERAVPFDDRGGDHEMRNVVGRHGAARSFSGLNG